MRQSIVHVALVVRDYDEAIEFYTKKLNFTLVEDTYQPEQDKRWVVVAPPGSDGTSLLLARASTPEQEAFVGNQTGGRVFLFLSTDDFWRDHANLVSLGITFVREPKSESYGTVAVFKDLYGNLWDLLELKTEKTDAGLRRAVIFGIGALSLEMTGSLFHAYALRDVALSLERMVRGDILVGGLASVAILAWQAVGRGPRETRAFLSWCLGFLFALFLELLNNAFPGALFRPKDVVSGVVVWSYVILGTLAASVVLSGRRGPQGMSGDKSRR